MYATPPMIDGLNKRKASPSKNPFFNLALIFSCVYRGAVSSCAYALPFLLFFSFFLMAFYSQSFHQKEGNGCYLPLPKAYQIFFGL
jgi:hypothetical protein